MKEPSKRPTVTFEQLTHSNMLPLNALVERVGPSSGNVRPEDNTLPPASTGGASR
jgi:hypothetical protein